MNEKVLKVISEVLKVRQADLKPEMTIDQIDTWDSIKHMDLIVTLEEKFSIQFDGDEIADMQSIQIMHDLTCSKIQDES
jgi:acyl carrier protein